MSANTRQKACIACAESKRRCDKQLPECQRCLDRDVDCAYPQPKRKRRERDDARQQLPIVPDPLIADITKDFDLGSWDAMGPTPDLDISFPDMMVPYIPSTTAEIDDEPIQPPTLEIGTFLGSSRPWFLQEESWILTFNNHEPGPTTISELEPFMGCVEDMLKCWTRNGYNAFIHKRLYQKGMPECIQDAFTAYSAYTNRTPAVKDTILQIAEERSCALVSQGPVTTDGTPGIMAHLSRVQALLVYVFMRLFDGSVRMRASAERQLPTLRQWVVQMLQAVKRLQTEDLESPRPFRWEATEFDREYDTALEMWQLWILTESVRRTHLVADTVANIYQIMTKGWADCPGAVSLHTRRGLWDAESPLKWFELCKEKPTLLVPALKPDPMILQYSAEEFDDFAKLFWTYIVGVDKMNAWIQKSRKDSVAQEVFV